MAEQLAIESLREQLRYEARTGSLFWKVQGKKRRVGVPAGSLMKNGYRYVRVNGKLICEHRAAWAISHGEWPLSTIDHINGNPSDNRLENLRTASISENAGNRGAQTNNTSGFKGVSRLKQNGKWRATIQCDHRIHHLGYYSSSEKAAEVYKEAAQRLFGEFSRAE